MSTAPASEHGDPGWENAWATIDVVNSLAAEAWEKSTWDFQPECKGRLKFLPRPHGRSRKGMARFEREAKLLHRSSFTRPYLWNKPRWDSSCLSLSKVKRWRQRGCSKGPLPVDEALAICRQIRRRLEAAHDKGVIIGSETCQRDDHRGDKVQNTRFRPGKSALRGNPERRFIAIAYSEAMTRPGIILERCIYESRASKRQSR